jgi:hypothetical protein
VRQHHCAQPPHAPHTPHTTELSAPHSAPTEEHTQIHTGRLPRHTHPTAVRLPSVDGMLPESWLLLKYNSLQDTQIAIASHHGNRRCYRTQPVAHYTADKLIAYHPSNRVKSNRTDGDRVNMLHASAETQRRVRVAPRRHNQTASTLCSKHDARANATTLQCANITARNHRTHRTHHTPPSSAHPTPRQQKNTPRYTRGGFRATLT